MAASDHLHPEQLKMFMSAREIMAGYDPHEGDRMYKGTHLQVAAGAPKPAFPEHGSVHELESETNQDMWDRKLQESKPLLYNNLKKEGVKDPIPLTTLHYQGSHRPMVGGGQHRIAAMNDIDPDALMPVLHHENIIAAKSNPHYRYS
jgi:hypothetical protein